MKLIENIIDFITGKNSTVYIVALNSEHRSVALYHTKFKWLAKRKLKYYTRKFQPDGLVKVELMKI